MDNIKLKNKSDNFLTEILYFLLKLRKTLFVVKSVKRLEHFRMKI